MYTPASFQVTDPAVVMSFIREHSFGLLLTTDGKGIHDTRSPFVLTGDHQFLCGHIAKANPQWRNWDSSTKAKVIFSGPHAYISPSYYASEFNVPTWNYQSVSISGALSIIEDEEQVIAFIEALTSLHEHDRSNAWSLDRSDPKYMQLLSSIVLFQVEIAQTEASFKLNQNKSVEDQQCVVDHLRQSSSPMDQQVAALMEQNFKDI